MQERLQLQPLVRLQRGDVLGLVSVLLDELRAHQSSVGHRLVGHPPPFRKFVQLDMQIGPEPVLQSPYLRPARPRLMSLRIACE